jgi:hypothetical protein
MFCQYRRLEPKSRILSTLTDCSIFRRGTECTFQDDAIGGSDNEHILSRRIEVGRISDNYPLSRCQCDEESNKAENSNSQSETHDLCLSFNGRLASRNGCRRRRHATLALMIIHDDTDR